MLRKVIWTLVIIALVSVIVVLMGSGEAENADVGADQDMSTEQVSSILRELPEGLPFDDSHVLASDVLMQREGVTEYSIVHTSDTGPVEMRNSYIQFFESNDYDISTSLEEDDGSMYLVASGPGGEFTILIPNASDAFEAHVRYLKLSANE